MRTQKQPAANYVELTNEVYSLLVDAFGSGNKRALNYWKSVWDITSRPYGSVTTDSPVRMTLERANELTELTVDELQAAGRDSAAFATKLLAERAKARDMALGSFRELLDTFATNLPYVKETASATFDDLSSRLKELEKRIAPTDGVKLPSSSTVG